jgi:MFS superfamily sulfate permease-like transporter
MVTMADSSENSTPSYDDAQAVTSDAKYERTARIVEHAAFLDEDDHPQVLSDAISALIQEIHYLKPDLQHSSEWDESDTDAKTKLVHEARWRGATARRVAVKGAEEAISMIERAEELRSRSKGEARD